MTTQASGILQPVQGTVQQGSADWWQQTMDAAVAAAKTEKEKDIAGLKDSLITAQTEYADSKKKLEAAESLIDDFQKKIKDLEERTFELDDEVDIREHKRYKAAVELLDEALSRLPEIASLRRRSEALEGLLEASIAKFKGELKEKSIKEALAILPEKIRESGKKMLENCETPEKIAETLEELKKLGGATPAAPTHEPLPPGQLPEGQNNQPPPTTPAAAPKTRKMVQLIEGVR